jgi:L-histidine N-alpha-methyltransferase
MKGSREAARREIIARLKAASASVAPKYLYDPLGCRLFELITQLPEYYPTRTEKALLARHAEAIGRCVGGAACLVDLGAGNGEKAQGLLACFKPRQYVAIDIAGEFMNGALSDLRRVYPDMDVLGLEADLALGLELPPAVKARPRLFFYPGSSIGNFDPEEARALLASIRRLCDGGGGLLIGIDLVKPPELFEAAYDDGLGVTAAFNLNLLNHLNALIGSDFRLRDWQHRAFYNRDRQRVEMHLEARREVRVSWPGGTRRFRHGERIHTENSYKYDLDDFKALLTRSGFGDVRAWTDERRWFAVFHGRAG